MKRGVVLIFLLLLATGCAGRQMISPIATGPGFYHRVLKGETLWSISRQYNTPIRKLVRVNRLPQASRIDVGQLLFVPQEKKRARISGRAVSSKGFAWPVEGRVISTYGSRQKGMSNKGIHIAARQGTHIVAAEDGRVTFAEDSVRGFGHMIIINHANNFQTVYAHNSENLVQEGDQVKQSDIIARVGSSSRSKQPYLHFEIRKDHKPKNPFYYLP